MHAKKTPKKTDSHQITYLLVQLAGTNLRIKYPFLCIAGTSHQVNHVIAEFEADEN